MSTKLSNLNQHTELELKDGTRMIFNEERLFQLHGLDMTLPVACDLCHTKFCDWELFDVHMASHIESRLFPCQLCNCTYKSWENLVAHRKTSHHGDMLMCDDCSTQKCFSNLVPVSFAVGMSPHGCEECNVGFSTYGQLIRHYGLKHNSNTAKCGSVECDRIEHTSPVFKPIFFNSNELSMLASSSWKSDAQENRSLLKTNRKFENMKSIMTALKDLPKKLICEYCTREFSKSRNLKLHVQRHLGERPYSCLFCTMKFYTKQQLTIHNHQHTGVRPYECKLCDKTFQSPTALYIHRRLHTASKTYSCAQCGKQFFRQTSYIAHVRLHTGERPFACHLCKKAFTVKGKLNSHLKTHKLVTMPKYQCTDCNKCFSSSVKLLDHQNDQCFVTLVTLHREEEKEVNNSFGLNILDLGPM